MNRTEMIQRILDEVWEWELDTLVDWIQTEMKKRLQVMTNLELKEELKFLFGEDSDNYGEDYSEKV